MPISVRGESDDAIRQVCEALGRYESEHPKAEIVVYRHSKHLIRIRVVDPGFRGVSRGDRHEYIWKFFKGLPDMVHNQISFLLLLTPRELAKSRVNIEFDDPIPLEL